MKRIRSSQSYNVTKEVKHVSNRISLLEKKFDAILCHLSQKVADREPGVDRNSNEVFQRQDVSHANYRELSANENVMNTRDCEAG